MRLALYCKCGAAARGAIEPDGKAEQFREWWNRRHTTAACGPATPREAAAARRKAESEDKGT